MQTLKDEEKKKPSDDEIGNKVDSLFIKQNNSSNNKKKKTKIGIKLPRFKPKKKNKQIKKLKETETKNDDFLETKEPEENKETKNNSKIENIFTNNKKTEIIKKNMKGKPVFLEDTGEKLGIVYDSIYDENNKLMGYRIKDASSDAVLSFPIDQFDEDKKGLIFIPSWYTKALKTVEKLEFKDRVSPELTALLTDDEEYNKELYQVFIKHDSEMADFIDETLTLKEMLHSHLKVLERKREAIKEDLMDLTERRLIKDIDRREFAEDVMEHRRKVNILEVNISKCKNLLKRLEETSFGVLGKNLILSENIDFEETNRSIFEEKKVEENPYKEKYLNLREKFESLENQYDELKNSVEKLIK
jgi:hypothetical protein